jgi:hypothetical protein
MGWGGVGCIIVAQDRNQWWAPVNTVIEIGWDSMDWIDLAEDGNHCRALVNTVMNPRVALNVRKLFSSS